MAFGRIKEFTDAHTKRLLVVEDNEIERASIVELLDYDDIETVAVDDGEAALDAMRDQAFDCVVLDLRLPDMSGFELLDRMQAEPAIADVPVVVFTGKELTDDEMAQLKIMAKSIVLKDVQSPERLLDETALFLHRVVTELPPEKQQMLERLHGSNEVLRGRKVLVVDDDARNIFALTSVLENHDMQVISATNGRQAIELIQQHARPQRGADGHHDAGHGRLRDDARDPAGAAIAHTADPRVDGQGNERRPRKVPRRRRQ